MGVKVSSISNALKAVKIGDNMSLRHRGDEALEIVRLQITDSLTCGQKLSREIDNAMQHTEFRVESILIDQGIRPRDVADSITQMISKCQSATTLAVRMHD